MKAEFVDEDGQSKPMVMGCYGIGVSRIVAAAIEQNYDDSGMIFPQAIAPFEVVIAPIGFDKNQQVRQKANELYDQLIKLNIDVLLDDRGLRPGVMFSEAELIGIPHRITISEKTLANNQFEYKSRKASDSELLDAKELLNKFS
jgi:prolyl-tRNA synthetase